MTHSSPPADSLIPPRVTPTSLLREATGVFQLPRLALGLGGLRRAPRGDGSRVLVLPGFGASDWSTLALRTALGRLGYRTSGWALGRNTRDVPDSVERIGERVKRLVDRDDTPLSLVGWSLGGYIAREVARDLPAAVRRVVTLGSPVIGGPKYTTAARAVALQGYDVDEIEREVERRKEVPLRVPTSAIYSRSDGVVAWRACVDPEAGAPIEHIEVDASHIGLGFTPEVIAIVAAKLAEGSR